MRFKENNNSLNATYKFRDFRQAFSFMTQVAFIAEKMDHHPNWSNVYNEVHIELTTHSEGNTITDKDRKMARDIERIYEVYVKGEQF